jgi:hypothetical protein
MRTEKATLIFETYDQAKEFSIAWSRETMAGHVHGNKEVIVYNIDKKRKKFITNYVKKLNDERDNQNQTSIKKTTGAKSLV